MAIEIINLVKFYSVISNQWKTAESLFIVYTLMFKNVVPDKSSRN